MGCILYILLMIFQFPNIQQGEATGSQTSALEGPSWNTKVPEGLYDSPSNTIFFRYSTEI